MTVVLVMTYTSCSDEDTTDTTGFALYYLGMTDIGPSMSGIISEPSYKGSVPSDFTITGITLNGESYTGNNFIINKLKSTVQKTHLLVYIRYQYHAWLVVHITNIRIL
jgi:hypothetical protein